MSGKYRVLEPCVYVVDGAAVHHREAGALVDLPAAVVAELGDAVELASPPPRPPTRHKLKPLKSVSGPGDDHPLGEGAGDGE
jgi:hypothetical protein